MHMIVSGSYGNVKERARPVMFNACFVKCISCSLVAGYLVDWHWEKYAYYRFEPSKCSYTGSHRSPAQIVYHTVKKNCYGTKRKVQSAVFVCYRPQHWLSHTYFPAQPLWGLPSGPLLLAWIDGPQHCFMQFLHNDAKAIGTALGVCLFIYLLREKKKADIFKKQIVTWRVLWIIAFSFLAYGTNWISGEVGWELPFKRNLLLVGLANCLAHIKEGKQAVTLHFIYIHKPYTVQIDYC